MSRAKPPQSRLTQAECLPRTTFLEHFSEERQDHPRHYIIGVQILEKKSKPKLRPIWLRQQFNEEVDDVDIDKTICQTNQHECSMVSMTHLTGIVSRRKSRPQNVLSFFWDITKKLGHHKATGTSTKSSPYSEMISSTLFDY